MPRLKTKGSILPPTLKPYTNAIGKGPLTAEFEQLINLIDKQYGGLTMVVMPNGMECHTKESIEHTCLQENQAHFNQACETPLLQAPIYGLLGPLGTGTATSVILNDSFQYPYHSII